MTISSKGCKPDNLESHNFLKQLSKTTFLCVNFVECESFIESKSADILALCETNFDDSIDSGNFSVTGTRIHSLAVYVNEGLSLA